MSPDELRKIADLLGLVYIPGMVEHATALNASKACTELSRLQDRLRSWADEMEQAK